MVSKGYSAVNQGQLNQEIVDAVVHHLKKKLPTVPRSIRHGYTAAFLLATEITKWIKLFQKLLV